MAELVVQDVDPRSIHPSPRNPRSIDATQLDRLKRSMQADPEMLRARPVIALPGGEVVAGNQRLRAALELGWDTVPTVFADLDERRAQEWMLRDNNEFGAWVDDSLADLLAELDAGGTDLSLLGFEDGELERLLGSVGGDGEAAGEDPGAGEVPTDPITRPGDLWVLGEHRVLCGDATVKDDVNRLLGDVRPVLMATDPPYGVELDQGWRDRIGLNGLGRSQDDQIKGDDRIDWSAAFTLSDAAVAVVWHAGVYAGAVHAALDSADYEVLQQIVWVKNMAPLSRSYYHWRHEPAWFARRKGRVIPWHVGRDQTTVWEAAPPKHIMSGSDEDKYDHPTQKPIALWLIPMTNHTLRGEAVYDPFGGSGTALAAAEHLGRVARLMEISPGYCDVIVERWEKMTGATASRQLAGSA